MNKQDEHELKDKQNWDYERLETREPIRNTRVVVSVAFRRQDFENVSKYAERLKKKVSEFIREAALEKATGRGSATTIHAVGSTGAIWLGNNLPSITQVHIVATERIEAESIITSG